jgi:heme/copper-type cytochrome/quinol oxidase subunit 3
MSDAVLFAIVFVGFFVLRIVAATLVFFWLVPRGDRCPNCDTVTLRVQSKAWNTLLPWFRTSWCYHCNWEGLHRNGPLSPQPKAEPLAKKP